MEEKDQWPPDTCRHKKKATRIRGTVHQAPIAQEPLLDFARSLVAPVRLYPEVRDGLASPSSLCVLVYCLAYVSGAVWLHMHGFTPFNDPWLVLAPDVYYLAEAGYLTPLIFLVWILGAGTIQVLSRLVGGRGRFDATLRITGYAFWAPWYPLIIVDSTHSTPDWLWNAILAGCFIWLLVGTAISTRIEQRLAWEHSAVISVVMIVVISGITFTYIR